MYVTKIFVDFFRFNLENFFDDFDTPLVAKGLDVEVEIKDRASIKTRQRDL